MRRVASLFATLLMALALLGSASWVGYRLWLRGQSEEVRATVEAMSPREFLRQFSDFYFLEPIVDRAGFGRRNPSERGHSPWVLRTSLDGRPRMLSLALAPEVWLAYSTETASLHQLWRGDIEFTGAVYDARHGAEPRSRGRAYLRAPAQTVWRVGRESGERPPAVQWRAHGVDPASGEVWLRFELQDAGQRVVITEWPEVLREGSRIGLRRRFVRDGGSADIPISMRLDAGADELASDGALLDGGTRLRLNALDTHLLQWFDAPRIPIEEPDLVDVAPLDELAAEGCASCHDLREHVAGPAWQQIAARHAGSDGGDAARSLAARIREGSVGHWGQVPMPAHPGLSAERALVLAKRVLAMKSTMPPPPRADRGARERYDWTYAFDTEPPLAGLHPSLSLESLRPEGLTPKVGGMAWLPDGRLVVVTWDRDGAAFVVEGWREGAGEVRARRIAEGLHEPLGVAVVDGEIYVMQKQEITRLIDHDGDGWTDEYRTLSNDWQATSNFHEFGFGLVHHEGFLYGTLSVCVLPGGKSCPEQSSDRGKVFRASLATGEVEFVASGFRTPNGIGRAADGRIFVTDNQGDWLPASKLIRLEAGSFHGWRSPAAAERPGSESARPALWLPQSEIGNSPTQPLVLSGGPYRGQLLFGDIYNGGIKRAYLEEVEGVLQGAAFHFTAGLEGGAHRLLEAPDGSIVVGEVGSAGNWSEAGKRWFGLELLRFDRAPAFEPLSVQATPAGFEVTFTQPLAPGLKLGAGDFQLQHWFYVPSELYGGPKYDLAALRVRDVRVAAGRRSVALDVEGLEAGRVVYLRMDRRIESAAGERLWVNEAWYTLNAIPSPPIRAVGADQPRASPHPPEVSLRAPQQPGFRPLFDGESFEGWKVYGQESLEGWGIEDGSLVFLREVSFLGLVWNHLNPFRPAALDLMTREKFCNFELSIDWKISAGGNSGIFYAVPDESQDVAWYTGLEMQVLDDVGHSDGRIDKRRAGDLYDIKASSTRAVKPAGAWNRARVRLEGDAITHWLNGEKVLEIERRSPEWQAALAASKFAGDEGFGSARCGHILLQDHGDRVWYRNVEILALP